MNISITAIGSRGDVQPYVALGIGLRKSGCAVKIIADPAFEIFILKNGLSFSPISANPRKIFEEEISKMGKNIFRFSKWIKEQYKHLARQNIIDLLEATENTDAIIFSPLASIAYHVAESKNIPCIGAYLQPLTPTRMFAPTNLPALPTWLPFKGLINWSMFRINSKVYLYMIKDVLNECREEFLNLKALPWKEYSNADLLDVPIIYGFSEFVIPKPIDWKENIHISGYWFLKEDKEWIPPIDLLQFIHSGPSPIYFGFGSMIDREMSSITNMIIEALRVTGQRGILSSGWNELNIKDLPENIFLVNEIPHDWLFPQMAAIVHHGGAGTTAAGFKAGVPQVVIPFSFDQPFWGRKVYELGVGPRPISRKKITVNKLTNAVNLAVKTQEYKYDAKLLSQKIQNEFGIENAIKHIVNILAL